MKGEKAKLKERLNEVSLWLHEYSFYNNLTFNAEFDVMALVQRACALHCTGIEINIEDTAIGKTPIINLSPKTLNRFKNHLDERSLEIGIDIKSTKIPKLRRALEVGRALGAQFIRCYSHPKRDVKRAITESVCNLKSILPSLGEDDLLVIENHELLRGSELAAIKRELGDQLQILYDYGNSLPAGETPEETLDTLKEHIVVAHLKDEKIMETDNGLRIVGVPLGEGNVDIKRITRRLLLETPVKIIALQNVFGYSTTFFRGHRELLKQVGQPRFIEHDKYIIIDYKRMKSDKDYREKVLADENFAVMDMVKKVNDILSELRQETVF